MAALNHILVIDDEQVIGDLIKRVVENVGYSATVCQSSEDVHRAIQGKPPTLIISDFNLPGSFNGVELCLTILNSLQRQAPVIIISGQPENERVARQMGFEFMRKPLTTEKLLLLVQKCLARHVN